MLKLFVFIFGCCLVGCVVFGVIVLVGLFVVYVVQLLLVMYYLLVIVVKEVLVLFDGVKIVVIDYWFYYGYELLVDNVVV